MAIYVDKIGFSVNKKYFIQENCVHLFFKRFYSQSLVICTQFHRLKLKFSHVFERKLYFRNDRDQIINFERVLNASIFLFRICNLFLEASFLIIELTQCLRNFFIFGFQWIYYEGIGIITANVSMINVWLLVGYEIESLMIFFPMQRLL
jgi:hypothetical protein